MDISIIIPTLNRDALLMRTLETGARSIAQDKSVEVIVVDNGSRDHTADACRTIKEQFPRINWRYFYDDMPGLLTGRHRGAKEAQGQILAFLDDDVLLAPTWLEGLRDAFRDPSVVLAGGPSRPEYEVNPPPWLAAFWNKSQEYRSLGWLSLIDQGPEKKLTDPCLIWGLNYAIRKEALLACGGFHPDIVPKSLQRFQGDGETGLSLKVRSQGLGALYHPHISVTHLIPTYRLRLEAFQQRAFYQGVCDSYTAIRRQRFVSARRRSLRNILRPIKRWIRDTLGSTSDEFAVVSARLYDSYRVGFEFHQNEARNDPKLLEWICRPDYWDYWLPEIPLADLTSKTSL